MITLMAKVILNIHDKLFDFQSEVIKQPYQALMNNETLSTLFNQEYFENVPEISDNLNDFANKYSAFLSGIEQLQGQTLNKEKVLQKTLESAQLFLEIPKWIEYFEHYPTRNMENLLQNKLIWLMEAFQTRAVILYSWITTRYLGELFIEDGYEKISIEKIDQWRLWNDIKSGLGDFLPEETDDLKDIFNSLRTLVREQKWFDSLPLTSTKKILESWLSVPEVQISLKINRFEDILWFNHEAFKEFIQWMSVLNLFDALLNFKSAPTKLIERTLILEEIFVEISEAEEKSEYQIQKLLNSFDS